MGTKEVEPNFVSEKPGRLKEELTIEVGPKSH